MSRVQVEKRSRDFMNNNRGSVSMGQTVIDVAIVKVDIPENKVDKAPNANIVVINMKKEPFKLEYSSKQIKDENNKSRPGPQPVDDDGNTGIEIKPGDQLWTSTYDAVKQSELVAPILARVAVSVSLYKDNKTGEMKRSYKLSKIRPSWRLDDKDGFKRFVAGSKLAEYPLLDNFSNDQQIKSCIFPLEHKTDNMVCNIMFDYSSPDRLKWVKSDDDTITSIGFNRLDGTKTKNSFDCEFITETETCGVEVVYPQGLFDVFGVVLQENWNAIAPLLVTNCKDAYLFGYAKRDNLMKLSYNNNDPQLDDDGKPKYFTQIFGTKLNVNLMETIRSISVPISREFALSTLKERKCKGMDTDRHPINKDWEERMTQNTPNILLNLSEFSGFHRSTFFDEKLNENTMVEFWGIFAHDETQADDLKYDTPNVEDLIKERKIVPNVVFAAINRTKEELVKIEN